MNMFVRVHVNCIFMNRCPVKKKIKFMSVKSLKTFCTYFTRKPAGVEPKRREGGNPGGGGVTPSF